jgi:alpha-galactosidase
MHRRGFLRLTGFSAAALVFQKNFPAGFSGEDLLHFPSGISCWMDGQWKDLTGSKESWKYQDMTVKLVHADGSLRVSLRSPGIELSRLRIRWKQGFSSKARCLGDAWELSYGDLAWTEGLPSTKAPWYLLTNDGTSTHAFGVRTGAACFCSWQAGLGQLDLFLDTQSGAMGVLLGNRELQAAEIITTCSRPGETAFQTDARFCKMMCKQPRLPAKPVYGINDWYFAYGKNSKEQILERTAALAVLAQDNENRPFSVIDDGWMYHDPEDPNTLCWGSDFSKSNDQFGDMAKLADEIKKLGMRPGLWTRTLLANSNDRPSGLTPLRPGENNPKKRYLDPTIPENIHRIQGIIRGYKDWGFELIKHDYSTFDCFGRWGDDMKETTAVGGWHFQDRSRTNAEIVLTLYQAIREAAGDMYLIGCNTVSHLSAGLFELNRIGDDTSGKEWTRTLKMGVNSMAFRLPQHGAFYAVDGDCVGLTTLVPWEKNKQWMQLLAESGAPLFISAQKEATGPEQQAFIKQCFSQASIEQPTGEPLDWMTNPRPGKWKLNGREVEFAW